MENFGEKEKKKDLALALGRHFSATVALCFRIGSICSADLDPQIDREKYLEY